MSLNKNSILSWFYYPNNNHNIDDVIESSKKMNIPYDIVIMKYIQLLCFNGMDNNNINDSLKNQLNVTANNEILDRIRNEAQHDDIFPYNLNNICSFDYPQNIMNKSIAKNHEGYPLVDTERGRPHIGWCICYHENCMQQFPCSNDLRNHLKLFNHKPFFHKHHENSVKEKGFTPEKVIKENLTKCPSPLCDKIHFDTPKELIKHLTLLGIEPFWQIGMDVRHIYDYNKNKNEEENNEKKKYPPFKLAKCVYRLDTCLCCFDKKPEMVFFPCRHSNLCSNCYQKLPQKLCPECRQSITNCLPY
jgi:Zinc finger, C3HC4 type (RING finger)